MPKYLNLLAILTTLVLSRSASAADPPADIDPYDQSKTPVEVNSAEPGLIKIVLVAGPPSHGPGDHEYFAGMALLANQLRQTPGVFPVIVRNGWPKNEKVFDGAKSIVFFNDGRGGHPIAQEKGRRMNLLQQYIDKGAGFACLHYAVDYDPKDGERVQKWLGGYYDIRTSINPFWLADYKEFPDHPICRGVKPFKQQDEWYYNMSFVPDGKGVTHILKAVPPDGTRGTADAKKYPGRAETTAWAYDRPDGGRAFGFTGLHSHKFWANDNYRRVIVNGILWTAKVEIPATGTPCVLDPKDLAHNLDFKGFDLATQLKLREEVKSLKARLAEVEKENQALKAR